MLFLTPNQQHQSTEGKINVLYAVILLFSSKLGFSQILETLFGLFWWCLRVVGITPSKVNRFGWNLEHYEYVVRGLALADFGRDPLSSDSRWARWNFVFFCQVSSAWSHRIPVAQSSQNLNTTHRSVLQWKLLELNFENLPIRGHLKNAKK